MNIYCALKPDSIKIKHITLRPFAVIGRRRGDERREKIRAVAGLSAERMMIKSTTSRRASPRRKTRFTHVPFYTRREHLVVFSPGDLNSNHPESDVLRHSVQRIRKIGAPRRDRVNVPVSGNGRKSKSRTGRNFFISRIPSPTWTRCDPFFFQTNRVPKLRYKNQKISRPSVREHPFVIWKSSGLDSINC